MSLNMFTHLILCIISWLGDRCDEDTDGCTDDPCKSIGTNCTDLTPEEEAEMGVAYVCADCPTGLRKTDGACTGSAHSQSWSPRQHHAY